MKTSPKGFSASKCDVGIFLIYFFENFKEFSVELLAEFFGGIFFGGIFWEKFFGRIFLGGFFGRIFGRIFWEEFFVYIRIDLFCQDFGVMKKEGEFLIIRSATQAYRT